MNTNVKGKKKMRCTSKQIAMSNVIPIGHDRFGYGKTGRLPGLLGFRTARDMRKKFSEIIGVCPGSIHMFIEEFNPNSKTGGRSKYYKMVREEYANISDLEILAILKGILMTF